MGKRFLLALSFVAMLMVLCIPQQVFAVDRTAKFGVVIAANICDQNGIAPSMVKTILDETYARHQVAFQALRIDWAYDPVQGASTVANKLATWVNYFDDYYSNIYLSIGSVRTLGRMLTLDEINTWYSALASAINGYSAVKVVCPETEVEAKQVDPYTGQSWGNSAAYGGSWSTMKNYIITLYNRWHAYSSKPVSWMHIVPISDDGTTIQNNECWFFGSTSSTEYWNWVYTYDDILSINEWRYTNNYGVGIWVNKVNQWNRDIFIGETFSYNMNPAETEQLVDAFGSHLKFFFWWMSVVPEPIPDYSPGAPYPYIYFAPGSQAHGLAWAHLQKKLWGTIWGTNLCSFNTYSESTSDVAIAYKITNFVSSGTQTEDFKVTFNFDMWRDDGNGGNELTLAHFQSSAGYYYALTILYEDGKYYMKAYWPSVTGGTLHEVFYIASAQLKPNLWYMAQLRHQGLQLRLYLTQYNPDGSQYFMQLFSFTDDGCPYDLTITQVSTGAFGGQKVKFYNGDMGLYRGYTAIWQELWNNGLTGWSTSYTQPSYVHVDDVYVYDYGSNWMLQQIKS